MARIFRKLAQLLDVDTTGAADGDSLTYDDGTGKWVPGEGGAGSGAPADATYLTTTANGSLSAEVVVGATPGGELGGTWASPTVDATHSGSTHAAVQAAAEATAAGALASHEADTTSVHGITNTASLETTTGAQSKVDTHSADTTSVHGITDTSALETTTGAQTKVDTHVNDTSAAHAASAIAFTPTGNLAATDAQAAIAEAATDAASALSTHESDTTSVHGITDTSALALTTNVVTKALYDANTVLAADSDNTPAALTLGASTILARLAAGNIKAATPSELRTLLDVPTNAEAVLDTLYDANTVLKADSDNTPAALTMGASTVLARLASGSIVAATVAEMRTLLGVPTPIVYTEFTSSLTTAATTEGGASTIVDFGSQTYDGTSVYEFELQTPTWSINQATRDLFVILHDGTSVVGQVWTARCLGANLANGGFYLRRMFVPSAGTRTYTLRSYLTGGAATATFHAGTGGTGAYNNGFYRLRKV